MSDSSVGEPIPALWKRLTSLRPEDLASASNDLGRHWPEYLDDADRQASKLALDRRTADKFLREVELWRTWDIGDVVGDNFREVPGIDYVLAVDEQFVLRLAADLSRNSPLHVALRGGETRSVPQMVLSGVWGLRDSDEAQRIAEALDRAQFDPARGHADFSFTILLWWRWLVITRALSEPSDSSEIRTHRVLTPLGTVHSAAALEPVIGATYQILSSESVQLSPEDESFIRAELQIIQAQHRVIEGADVAYIERAVGRVARRLLSVQAVGVHARQTLLTLDADPPEVVDQIIEQMSRFIELVALEWGDTPIDSGTESTTRAENILEANEHARGLEEVFEEATGLADELKRKFVSSVVDGAGKTVGTVAATTALGAAGALAVAVTRMPGIDAVVLWLMEAAPRLLEVYTYRRDRSVRA